MSFKEMAAKREEEAAELEDDEIWANIISKFIILDHPVALIIEMMLETVGGDRSIIENALETCLKRDMVQKELIENIQEQL